MYCHDTQEQEQLIGAVMRFMLFKHRQKPAQPVRRSELAKLFQASLLAFSLSPCCCWHALMVQEENTCADMEYC